MLATIITRPEIIVPLGAFAVAIVAIICNMIVRVHKASRDFRLKEMMLQKGMSVDEMERLLGEAGDYNGPAHQDYRKPMPSK